MDMENTQKKNHDSQEHSAPANLKATHVWFGPYSPLYEHKERELSYLHIFFPKHL
jgi:hypothetical protein